MIGTWTNSRGAASVAIRAMNHAVFKTVCVDVPRANMEKTDCVKNVRQIQIRLLEALARAVVFAIQASQGRLEALAP
jgi:hypothetical protein